jgi:hypothetical protein
VQWARSLAHIVLEVFKSIFSRPSITDRDATPTIEAILCVFGIVAAIPHGSPDSPKSVFIFRVLMPLDKFFSVFVVVL